MPVGLRPAKQVTQSQMNLRRFPQGGRRMSSGRHEGGAVRRNNMGVGMQIAYFGFAGSAAL